MTNKELKEIKKEQEERIRLLKLVVKQKNDLAELESQLNLREKQELNKQKVNVEIQNEKEKVGLDRIRTHTKNVKQLHEYQDKLFDLDNQVKALPEPKKEIIIPALQVKEEVETENDVDGITALNPGNLINVCEEESKEIPVIDQFPIKKKE